MGWREKTAIVQLAICQINKLTQNLNCLTGGRRTVGTFYHQPSPCHRITIGDKGILLQWFENRFGSNLIRIHS